MDLKHEEKIKKYNLSKELAETNWKNATKRIVVLRNQIKNDTMGFMEIARIHYNKTH